MNSYIGYIFRLLNLLKQYGGLEECMKYNTPAQNEQQLKNFDLSEYRQVIFTTIIVSYQQIVQQIQEIIKVHIVPAILDHDEMARGKQKGNKHISNPKCSMRLFILLWWKCSIF